MATTGAIEPNVDTLLVKKDDSSPEDQWWKETDAPYWELAPIGTSFMIDLFAESHIQYGEPAVYLRGPRGTFLMPLHWFTEDHFQVVDDYGQPIIKQTRYVFPS